MKITPRKKTVKRAPKTRAPKKPPKTPDLPPETTNKPEETPPMLPLKTRQKIFVKEYLIDLNATRAAIAAGYSERSAKEIGRENITKPHIAAAIKLEMDARAKKLGITAESVVEEVHLVAFAKAEGPVRWENKLKALELLARHLGILHDKTELTGADGGPMAFTDLERATKLQRIIAMAKKRRDEPGSAKDSGNK